VDGVRGAAPALRGTARITGLGIAADIQRTGAAALVGREVKSTRALAKDGAAGLIAVARVEQGARP